MYVIILVVKNSGGVVASIMRDKKSMHICYYFLNIFFHSKAFVMSDNVHQLSFPECLLKLLYVQFVLYVN